MTDHRIVALQKLREIQSKEMPADYPAYIDFLRDHFSLFSPDETSEDLRDDELHARDNYAYVNIHNLIARFHSIVDSMRENIFRRGQIVAFVEYLNQESQIRLIDNLVPDPDRKARVVTASKGQIRVRGVFAAQLRIDCDVAKNHPRFSDLNSGTVNGICHELAEKAATQKITSDVEKFLSGAYYVHSVNGILSSTFSLQGGKYAVAFMSAESFVCRAVKENRSGLNR